MDSIADAEPFKIEWNNTQNIISFILSNNVAWHPSSLLEWVQKENQHNSGTFKINFIILIVYYPCHTISKRR